MISCELARIVADLTDPEHLGACRLGRRRQQVGVRVEDLLLVAQRQTRIDQLRAGGDHHHPRPRSDQHLVQPDAGQQADVARTEMIALRNSRGPAVDVLADPPDVLADLARHVDLDVALTAIGGLVRHDRVGAARAPVRPS